MSTALDLLRTVGPSVAGGFLSRRAAGSASRRLAGGVDTAATQIRSSGADLLNTWKNTLQGQQQKLQPYEDVGAQNLNTLNSRVNAPVDKFSFTGADLQNDPGYQFGLNEGAKTIDAQGNAAGNRYSGGTLKALDRYRTDYATTKFNDAYGRAKTTFDTNYRSNQDQLKQLQDLAGMGQQATTQDVNAQGAAATGAAQATMFTGKELADLAKQKAEALAGGDVQKANAIQTAIEQATSALQGRDLINAINGKTAAPAAANAPNLPPGYTGYPNNPYDPNFTGPVQPGSPQPGDPNFVGPVAPTAAIGGGAALASTAAGGAAAGATPAVSVVIPGVTDALAGGAGLAAAAAPAAGLAGVGAAGGGVLAGTGALATPEIAAPSLAAGAGGSGMGAAITGFLTNPVTIGVGAALAAAIIWKKSQVHPTANTFVNGYQKGFEQHLGNVVNQFDAALASGKLDQATAKQLRDQTAQFIQGFDADIASFRQKGSKERKVADQAKAEMTKDFGANWEGILGKMDSEIAGLPAGQAA